MGVLILPLTLALAWLFAILGVTPMGGDAGDTFAQTAMLWMFNIPAGPMFVVSGLMHTVWARSTAANIGWETNGFQYELGFVSLGIGIAGIAASWMDPDAWIALTIVITVFLIGAAVNHIVEMARDSNFAPGNSLVLIYDIGLPVSMWALLFATDSI